ncbi:DNA-binding ferritin-like protein [Serpentinimonas raichei]|uniref:DNA-binding ferritin-like protein n=1 Tax=Serpentinimonas raichei TaxID=1458425 RepID=A0A060NJZ1_9BURK|nr:sigma-E factor negative regulatory protein [Serpentinimonas raichei]BAO81570.1 DNA-binding ferritin-like protein [Serpentinimonas raichei]
MQTKPSTLAADSGPTDAAPVFDEASAPPLEWLSALLDGECPPERVAQATAAHAGSGTGAATDLYADWSRYHWIGEALRGSAARPVPLASPAFADAVLARLAQEPAPARSPVEAAPAPTVTPPQAAANDAVFRWKMVAGLASVATMAALSWSFLLGGVATDQGQQWAQAPAPQAVAVSDQSSEPAGLQGVVTAKGLMWRDPQLDTLLAAHRQHGGMNALHVPVGFLRNATYDHSAP